MSQQDKPSSSKSTSGDTKPAAPRRLLSSTISIQSISQTELDQLTQDAFAKTSVYVKSQLDSEKFDL